MLVEQGYRPSLVARRLGAVAQLSSWLGQRRLTSVDLTVSRVEQFLDEVASSSRYRRRMVGLALRQLLGYLRGLGVTPVPAPSAVSGPAELLLARLGDYLVRERGIGSHTGTVRDYRRVAWLFLSEAVTAGGGWAGLTTAAVSRFVLGQCRGRSVRWGRLCGVGAAGSAGPAQR